MSYIRALRRLFKIASYILAGYFVIARGTFEEPQVCYTILDDLAVTIVSLPVPIVYRNSSVFVS